MYKPVFFLYFLCWPFIGFSQKYSIPGDYADTTKSIPLKEVQVSDKKGDANIKSVDIGSFKLEATEIKKLPALLGEADPLKAIQLMPGVQSGSEGNTGLIVRGGGVDQNLILLDDVPIYNVSHLFGFFSVFNANALQSVSLIKAGIPAKFGGRTSSVLQVQTKTGNTKNYETEGGIGFLTSNITVQGPIKRDTSSFIFSARRTYLDLFKKLPFQQESPYSTDLFFYDLNAKLYFMLSPKNKIYVNGFMGKDDFQYNDNVRNDFSNALNWGTKLASIKWLHVYSDQLAGSVLLSYCNYKMNFDAGIYSYLLHLGSDKEDYSAKFNFVYSWRQKHSLNYGFDYTFHTFSPNNLSAHSVNSDFSIERKQKLYGHEFAAYLSDEFVLSEKIAFNAGLRWSVFEQTGPFQRYVPSASSQIQDTVYYKRFENAARYSNPEPRLSVRYLLNNTASLKLGYSVNYQYVHLAPVSSLALPTDIWIPSSSLIQPQAGSQYALGYFKNFKENRYTSSVEIYYKTMSHLMEYKEGIVSLSNLKSNFDDVFYFGNGKSYGAEFFVKKNEGRFTGWMGYTLAFSTRNFPDIEQGATYYSRNDRRHDLSAVGTYALNNKWSFSVVFVYKSGTPITVPVSRYIIEGNLMSTYSPMNAYRLPAYHRMDVSITYTRKKTLKRVSEWVFSIYNVYNRLNPYLILYQTSGDFKTYIQTTPQQVSLFPLLPSLSWNFKF
jgi:hypothetical protein